MKLNVNNIIVPFKTLKDKTRQALDRQALKQSNNK